MAFFKFVDFNQLMQKVLANIVSENRYPGISIRTYYTDDCIEEADNSTIIDTQTKLRKIIAELDAAILAEGDADKLRQLNELKADYEALQIGVDNDVLEVQSIIAGQHNTWESAAPIGGNWPVGIYKKQYDVQGTAHFYGSNGINLANGYPSNGDKLNAIGLNVQLEGSHGLCQIYALMHMLGATTELKTASNAYNQYTLGEATVPPLSKLRQDQAYNTASTISYQQDAIIRFYNTYKAFTWVRAQFNHGAAPRFNNDDSIMEDIDVLLGAPVDYWVSWFFEKEEPIPQSDLHNKTWPEIEAMWDKAALDVQLAPHLHNVLYTPIQTGLIRASTGNLYNTYSVEDLRTSIISNAELLDNKLDAVCPVAGANKVAYAHQTLISQLFTNDYPYPGLLLWHGLGSGKTFTALELSKTHSTSNTLFISPASLIGNFRTELIEMIAGACAGGGNTTYSCPPALHAATDTDSLDEMRKIIRAGQEKAAELNDADRQEEEGALRLKKYEERSARAKRIGDLDVALTGGKKYSKKNRGFYFSRKRKFKKLNKKLNKTIKQRGGVIPVHGSTLVEVCNLNEPNRVPIGKSLDVHYMFLSTNGDFMDRDKHYRLNMVALHGNVLVLIDEMHLIVKSMYKGLVYKDPAEKVYADLYKLLLTMPNTAKLVGLSGTPISQNTNELAILFNLLLRSDTFSYERFTEDYPIEDMLPDFECRFVEPDTYNQRRQDHLRELNLKTIGDQATISEQISPVISFFGNIDHLMPQVKLYDGLTLEGYTNNGTLLYGIQIVDIPAEQTANESVLTGNTFMANMKSISSVYTMDKMPDDPAQIIRLLKMYKLRKDLPKINYKPEYLPVLTKSIDAAIAAPDQGGAHTQFEKTDDVAKIRFFTYHVALYNLIISSSPEYKPIDVQKYILHYLKLTNIKFYTVIMNILKNPDKRHLVYIEHQRAILPFFKYMQMFCYSEYKDPANNISAPVPNPGVAPNNEFPIEFPVIDAADIDDDINQVVNNYNAHIGAGGKKIAFVTGKGDHERDIFLSYVMPRKNEGKLSMDKETLLAGYKNQGIDAASRVNDLNIVVLNSAGTEGTNFPKTDFIHIIELLPDCAKLYQTIARIVRNCAHNSFAVCANGRGGNTHCGTVYPILYLTNNNELEKYQTLLNTQDNIIPYLNMLEKCSIECSSTRQDCLQRAANYP